MSDTIKRAILSKMWGSYGLCLYCGGAAADGDLPGEKAQHRDDCAGMVAIAEVDALRATVAEQARELGEATEFRLDSGIRLFPRQTFRGKVWIVYRDSHYCLSNEGQWLAGDWKDDPRVWFDSPADAREALKGTGK